MKFFGTAGGHPAVIERRSLLVSSIACLTVRGT